MNYKKITGTSDTTSRICAVAMAPAIIISTAATAILFPLTIFFSLLAGGLREKFSLMKRNPVVWMLVVFFLLSLVGAIYSTAPLSDILIVLRKQSKYLFAIMLFPVFAEEKWRNHAISAFMAGILVMLIASYLSSSGYLYGWSDGGMNVFKNSIESNILIAFAVYLCLIKIRSTHCCRWFWVVFLFLLVHTVLFRSIGRSGYLVFAGLVALFFFQSLNWKGLVMAVMGIALLFGSAYLFSPTFKVRIDQTISDIKSYNESDETTVCLRITFVKNALKLIKKHPILGTGTGSYAKEYSAIKPTPPDLKIINPPDPHNSYTYIGVQYGIVGIIILLLFFAVPLWYSRFLPEKEKYIARGIVITLMIGSLTNTSISDMVTRYLYIYFITLSFAALPKPSSLPPEASA